MSELDLGNMEAVELTADEMNEVAGGAYRKPAEKNGFQIYQIKKGDTLIRIANHFGIKDWKKIKDWNPKIADPKAIRAGDYLYIKA